MINPVYFSYISSPLYEPAGEEPVASGTEEMITLYASLATFHLFGVAARRPTNLAAR